MCKLLIVDDEEIEREGMANFIPWQEQGIKLVGTAWNGIQGLEMMEKYRPDVVFVDVKMPVMNGLEMIRRARQTFPDTIYVILSGFGEYEFTSRAMEEGVRHYLLKPCDEQKIMEVIAKIKKELQERKAQQNLAQNARLLLPHAKAQIFCDLLLGRAQANGTTTQYFLSELGGVDCSVRLIDVRLARGFDHLEQFVIGNMMEDLLPPKTLLCTGGMEKDTFLLVSARAQSQLNEALARLQTEFRRFETAPLQMAVSGQGSPGNLSELYNQVTELLALDERIRTGVLWFGEGASCPGGKTIFDYRAIQEAKTYDALLLELCKGVAKMRLFRYPAEKQERLFTLAWKLLEADKPAPELTLCGMAEALAEELGILPETEEDRTTQQMRKIYESIYRHLEDPELNLRKLAHEYLYISEDHLSRLFVKRTGMRLTYFLENRRVEVARALLEFAPQTTNACLAELVGYPPDGRYFAKAFRKQYGKTPGEYREQLPGK